LPTEFTFNSKISIVIVTQDGALPLTALLESLERALAAEKTLAFEILVAINGSDLLVQQLADEFRRRYAGRNAWNFMALQALSVREARNKATEMTTGAWVVFLDQDVVVPETYFGVLKNEIASKKEVKVIGGPRVAGGDASVFGRVTQNVLGSKFLTGPFAAKFSRTFPRHRSNTDCQFSLANLSVERHSLIPFSAEISLAEGGAMLLDMARAEDAFLFVPDLFVFGRSPENLAELKKQMLDYGEARGFLLKRYGWKASSNRLVFTAYLSALIALAAQPKIVVPAYLIFILCFSFRVSLRTKPRFQSLKISFAIILVSHFAYTFGCLIGGWKRLDDSSFLET
jgi:glycosyltransferase involved in cell wall biosynthesis